MHIVSLHEGDPGLSHTIMFVLIGVPLLLEFLY